jgi:nucleoporin POM152
MRPQKPLPPSPTSQGHALPNSVDVSVMAMTSSAANGSKSNFSQFSIIKTSTASLPPVILLEAVDAPTLQLYAVGLLVLLQSWKIYDKARLYTTDGDSISEYGFACNG